MRRCSLLVLAPLSALMLAGATSGAARPNSAETAVTGVELVQQFGKGHQLRLLLSSAGATATETKRGTPDAGVIVRYKDGRVFLLDYQRRSYRAETVAAAAKKLKAERTLVRKAHAEVRFRTNRGRPVFPASKLSATDLRQTIAGLRAQAYLLRQKGVTLRLWLAEELPAPPAAIESELVGATALQQTTGRALLRVEVKLRGRWPAGLNTLASQRVAVSEASLSPPEGWKEQRPESETRAPATVPARVLRLFGPVSARPDLFALYWNGPFSAAFRTGMNGLLASAVGSGAYWGPLGQYGVSGGAFLGSSPIAFPLPTTVGSWNFFAVEAMVTAAFVLTPAPKIWWRFGDRDPILAIMVPTGAVAASGWSGYHLFGLSAAALLPWPVSLAAHPEMPWFLVKAGGTVAGDSVNTTHELVEAASDPLPLSANVDFTKSPPWVGGEIADICSVGTSPGTGTAPRFGVTVSTYWSNGAGRCVG